MTLFFAATTALCLIVLASFAANADSDVRRRSDLDLLAQAKLFSVGVDANAQGFSFASEDPSATSNAGLTAIGSIPTGFVDAHGIAYASPSQNALPSSAVIDALFASAARQHAAVFTSAAGLHGAVYRWIAYPIGTVSAGIVLVGAPAPFTFSHQTLFFGLLGGVVVLVVVAAFTGHVLSGKAMRPALRQVEQQEQFLREAAHELRTPMSSLTLIAESGLHNPTSAVDSLHAISNRLSGMNAIITSLLIRARSESDALEVEKRLLRLDQLVEVAIEEMQVGRRVSVTTTPTVILGNADLLAQAVRNLVENALHHGPTPRVLVRVEHTTLRVGNSPSLDDGREKDPAVYSAGTGTGLSIVSWIATVHDADLRLLETATDGLEVTITFHNEDT